MYNQRIYLLLLSLGCLLLLSAIRWSPFLNDLFGLLPGYFAIMIFLLIRSKRVRVALMNQVVPLPEPVMTVLSSTPGEEFNIGGGWSGAQASQPGPSQKTTDTTITKKGRVILRGVVQKGASGMRLQVYEDNQVKQVEVVAGLWAKGIREGDIIKLVGYWKDKSYIKAYRIYNETTGVELKRSHWLAILTVIVLLGIAFFGIASTRTMPPVAILLLLIVLIIVIIVIARNKK